MKRKVLCFAIMLFVFQISFAGDNYERPEKIVMIWDLINRAEDNLEPEERIAHAGLDVISPTWFFINDENGAVTSLASMEYVQWAHNNGIKVWALFENKSDDYLTYEALSTRDKRKRIISQLAGYAGEYRLDGINIDFEAMRRETGKLFELFIVELYETMRQMGITVSVDISLPIEYISTIYDFSLITDNSDYVVIMAYDQHHSYSGKIGPVASIAWVKQGIKDTLKYVSGKKIILGIPFFAMVWLEDNEDGIIKVSSELIEMKDAYETFDKSAKIWGRDRVTEQIYAEYETGHKRYKVWLEDEHSLSLKLDTINDYDLAGMSAWRRGLEWPEIWDMINAYFK